jgi:hypothetical protein
MNKKHELVSNSISHNKLDNELCSEIDSEPEMSLSQTDDEVDTSGLLYIKFLPKDKLLWYLWKNAKIAHYMYYCPKLAPVLTLNKVRRDINYMIENGRNIELNTYYGKLLFVNITGDYLDTFTYNIYNGCSAAEHISTDLKIEELSRCVLKYHTFF